MTTGDPKGVKLQGGLLEVITREIEIECLPDEIPEFFTVDVTRADDRPEPARERDSAGRIDEAAEPAGAGDLARGHAEGRRSGGAGSRSCAATATPAEPEVIKKGKKEEEARRPEAEKEEEGQEENTELVPPDGRCPDRCFDKLEFAGVARESGRRVRR